MSPLLLTLSRRCIRIAAAVLAAAVFSVPTLAYAHDHLTTSDASAHFRPGKNIERPHDQQSSIVASHVAVAHVHPDVSGGHSLHTAAQPAAQTSTGSPVPPRAPPVG